MTTGFTSTTGIGLRRATLDDAELLAEFGARTFFESYAADSPAEHLAAYVAEAFAPPRQAAELTEPGSVFFTAHAGPDIVGYALLRQRPAPEAASGAAPIELGRLYAARRWIGRGVGSALMAAALAEAARRRCDTLWLTVWSENARGKDFYRRWGFVQTGTQVFWLGDDRQTDLVLQRPVPRTP